MIIALISDFGTRDYFVGAVKGTLLCCAPEAVIVDITHEIDPGDIAGAAFTLRACRNDFPAGTVFLAVVDPGVGSSRRAMAAESGGRYFVGPDNGLLGFVFSDDPSAEAFEILYRAEPEGRASRTFDGRDVFAPAAARIASGTRPETLGPRITDPVRFDPASDAETRVVHIDKFGNLVTNLAAGDLPAGCGLVVCGQLAAKRADFYEFGADGELLIIPGSSGFLEISVRGGSARKMTRATVGAKVEVREIPENA
jgi:hypothetical protein